MADADRSRPDPISAPDAPDRLWPPPGAVVTSHVLSERPGPGDRPEYGLEAGPPPSAEDLRILAVLLEEYEVPPAPSAPFDPGHVTLAIALTSLPGGRRGRSYALDGQALGADGAGAARGLLGRWIRDALGTPPS